ncbi:MAG: hypothetical protein JWM27_3829 [Gemmatimonadetes bacterium]|nr:hypothetical protein [Gemmatimonadota bacterium]
MLRPNTPRAVPLSSTRIVLLGCCAALLAMAAPARSVAQDTVPARPAAADTLREVRLTDGSRLIGTIVEETDDRVVVVTSAGARVELRRAQIASVARLGGRLVHGELWPEDPHATRLFIGPTGRALEAGEGYAGDFELFFPFVAYGVTDRLTIGAATVIAPEVSGRALVLTPKLQVVRSPRVNASVGVVSVFATEAFDQGTVGVLYGVGTFGSRDASVTLGLGFPFVATSDNSDIASHPVLQIGGETRVGVHTKLITESYFVPGESGGIVSGGVRLFGEHLSVDAGVATSTSGGGLLPLVNFVYSFGGARK